MAIDYERMAATARRLIESAGRDIFVRRLGSTPSDATKPWRGQADPVAPLAAGPVALRGVAVPPASLIELGFRTMSPELIQRSRQVFIAAPPEDGPDDLSGFDELEDYDGKIYRISILDTLRPATVTLLFFIGVEG